MEPIAVWRDLLDAAWSAGWMPGRALPTSFLPQFMQRVYQPHRDYFDGLEATYGPEIWGDDGALSHLVGHAQPLLESTLRGATTTHLDRMAAELLESSSRLLPGPTPTLYTAPLNFLAPAATVAVGGKPVVVVAPERFAPEPLPPQPAKFLYGPSELVEMVPHETCHVARMQALGLPPSPRELSLLDMVLLEGTALVFTDQIAGRTTLRTFLPPERMQWHEANEELVLATAAQDFGVIGMPAFIRYFAADSAISGYYVGYSLCRTYLDIYGPGSLPDLIVMPSELVLERLDGMAAPK